MAYEPHNKPPAGSKEAQNRRFFLIGGAIALALVLGLFLINRADAPNDMEPAAGFGTAVPGTPGMDAPSLTSPDSQQGGQNDTAPPASSPTMP